MNGVWCTCPKSSTPLVFTPINEKPDFNLTTQTFIMKLNTSHRERMSLEVCGKHQTFIFRQRCTVYFFLLKKVIVILMFFLDRKEYTVHRLRKIHVNVFFRKTAGEWWRWEYVRIKMQYKPMLNVAWFCSLNWKYNGVLVFGQVHRTPLDRLKWTLR